MPTIILWIFAILCLLIQIAASIGLIQSVISFAIAFDKTWFDYSVSTLQLGMLTACIAALITLGYFLTLMVF
jgi:hypothetical protein